MSRHRNVYGTPKLAHEPRWEGVNKSRMLRNPVVLDARMRMLVENEIRETCEFRAWKLHAINVRTNHAHTVISAGDRKPEPMLNAIKANATRCLRSAGLWDGDRSPWSDKGSTRYIWTGESLATACKYVTDGQGGEIPTW